MKASRANTWLTVLAVAASFGLEGTAGARDPVIIRPGQEEGPTPVRVAMLLMDVDEVNSADQNFAANLFIQLRWQDSRLAHPGPGVMVHPMDEIWNPEALFINKQRIWKTFPSTVDIFPDGNVLYRQRVWGSFSQPLKVQDFPFDRQDFELRIASANSDVTEVEFIKDPEALSGLAPSFSLPDWEILGWELNFEPYNPLERPTGSASVAMVFHARRHSTTYTIKVIIPLVLIVLMSSIVFWIDPKEGGTQIGLATTSMLTLIAYRFMVGNQIPPVPDLTRMDVFILGSTLLVFIALVESATTSFLVSRDRSSQARRLDRVFRVLFPATFVIIIYFSLFNRW